jgi:3-hydroxy-9,10-secoandrosta-1,3,5(10)-triene-9,17-dione monooxygenase reductase component
VSAQACAAKAACGKSKDFASREREVRVERFEADADESMRRVLTARELRDAFGAFATGVTVVTAVRPDGEPVGATANSFTSVSLDPPLILWCLSNQSTSLSAFTLNSPFAVHVLGHDQRDLALHFARRGYEKFDVDPHWRRAPEPPHIASALCRLDCRVYSVLPGGDHWIIVGEVISVTRQEGAPLVFQAGRFGRFTSDLDLDAAQAWKSLHGEWF